MRAGERMKMLAGTAHKYDAETAPRCARIKHYCYRGYDAEGRPTHRHFHKERELVAYDRQLAESKARRKHGLPAPTADLTFRELHDRFFDGYSYPRTERKVRAQLKGPLDTFGSKRAADITTTEIERYLNSLSIGARTQREYRNAIRQVYNFGLEAGLVGRNPAKAVRTPQPAPSDVRPFESWAEVRRVAAAMGNPTDAAIVLFAAATGLRPEEWIALEAGDVDRTERTVSVNKVCVNGQLYRDRGKTTAAFRTVHLTQIALDALDSIPRPLRGPQFQWKDGGYIPLNSWRRHWTKALKAVAAELADEQGITDRLEREQFATAYHRPLYQLRHTYATLALAAGAALDWISRELGHTNIQTTHSVYSRHIRPVHDANLAALDDFAAESDSARVKNVSQGAGSEARTAPEVAALQAIPEGSQS
jgi:integrase